MPERTPEQSPREQDAKHSYPPATQDYSSDFWIPFQTGPNRFRIDPWTDGTKRLKDRPPSIYGSHGHGSGKALSRPTVIEWIKDGRRFEVLVEEGLALETHYTPPNPNDRYPTGRETFSRLDDDQFKEAVEYAKSVDLIRQSGVLNGIEERRRATLQEETRKSQR